MRTRLTILLLTLSTILRAQSALDGLILTKEQSENWIFKFEKESKSGQLELTRKRLLLDTNIYINQSTPDRIKIDNEKLKGKRTAGYCRLVLFFNQDYFTNIDNRTKNSSIIKLTHLLTDKEIQTVSIVKEPQATSIYGSRASCGVILLTTKGKQILKRIKEINLE
jgi:TonB-dependent SusC/RagA subfamily outer membrane receptor